MPLRLADVTLVAVVVSAALIGAVEGAARKRKWDKPMACEGCKWLHAKLRHVHDSLEPKVRRYGGGFQSLSRSERAGMAVDQWCNDMTATLVERRPPVGNDEVIEFSVEDLKMLKLQCKKLQEKYRLSAVSLLSSLRSSADIPLSILCQDECFPSKKQAKPKPARPDREKPKPSRPSPPPSEEELRSMSVKNLKRYLGTVGRDVGPSKSDLQAAAIKKAAKQQADWEAYCAGARDPGEPEGQDAAAQCPQQPAGSPAAPPAEEPAREDEDEDDPA